MSKQVSDDPFGPVDAPLSAGFRPLAKFWWSIPAALLLLIYLLASLFGKTDLPESKSSLDASGDGYRAAYLLLSELGYPVTLSRRPVGGTVRFVLEPTRTNEEASALAEWVRAGGLLVLADDDAEFAKEIEIPLVVKNKPSAAATPRKTRFSKVQPFPPPSTGAEKPTTIVLKDSSVADVHKVTVDGPTLDWIATKSTIWLGTESTPLITIHNQGLGEVWLIHRPGMFRNKMLKKDDNAIVLVRLAQATLARRPGEIGFDEFFHGLRDRPNVLELLFTPPLAWGTLQAVLLTGLLVWRNATRFGAVRATLPPSRRSKQEFLDALALLLDRKHDYGDAYRTVRDDLHRRLARSLGLPAGISTALLAEEASRRRGIDAQELLKYLDSTAPPLGDDVPNFLQSLNELEMFRNARRDARPNR